jgi:hypothetical protein
MIGMSQGRAVRRSGQGTTPVPIASAHGHRHGSQHCCRLWHIGLPPPFPLVAWSSRPPPP